MGKIKRCPLSKRIPRDFTKNFGKYIGMILILVCTIAVGSSFQAAINGTEKYLDDIKTVNMQEDGYFETAYPVSEADMEYFLENGIRVYENFYVTEGYYCPDADKPKDTAKVLLFRERKNIDIPTVFSGRLPEKENEIAIDHVFARSRHIKVGDTVTLVGKEFYVCGTVSLPDYTGLFMNNTDIVMNTSHFGVGVVSEEAFASFAEGTVTYRYSYRFDDRGLSKSRKGELVGLIQNRLIEAGAKIRAYLTAEQNQCISYLEMDMGKDGPFMVVFVYLLVALIAFIFAILTNNTIENESVIIGTLLASGYKKSEVIWHYLQPTLIVGIVGSIIGNALGYTVMIKPFLDMYYTSYSVGPVHVEFSVAAFLVTTVLPVVIMVAINCWMLWRRLSLKPLKFLRRDLKKKKQKKAVKLPNFGFLHRFRLRVILQNKGSYIMLFIGIFLASFLLMFGLGLGPLMDHYTESIDESLPYNYQYILKAPVETDGGETLRVYEMNTWFKLGKKDIGVTMMGIDGDSRFFADALVSNGVSISSALSKKLNLNVGDTITLKDPYKETEVVLNIQKVYPYNASMVVFMDKNELNALLGEEPDSFNCILSEGKLDIPDAYLIKSLSREDFLGAAEQMMDSFSTVFFFVKFFAVVVYLILVYILTKVVIDKNALSISYMKVFGYEPKEIRKLYLVTTTIVVTASLIICIPVEALMYKFVLVYLSSMIDGYLEFYLPMKVYISIIIIGLAAYFGINAVHVRGVERIPMTDALKNRE